MVAELLKVTGMIASLEREIMNRVSARMVQLRSTRKYGHLPKEFFVETEIGIAEIVHDTLSDEDVIARFAPVYMEHFDANELKGLIEFYRSPLGQKVVSVQAAMASEFQRVSGLVEDELIIPEVIKLVESKLKTYSPEAQTS